MNPTKTIAAILTGTIEMTMFMAILAIVAVLTFMSYMFELAGFHYLFGTTFGSATIPILSLPVLMGFAIALNSAKVALTWMIAKRRNTKAGGTTSLQSGRAIIFVNSAIMTLLVCSFQITDLNAGKLLEAEQAQYRDKYLSLRNEALDRTTRARADLDTHFANRREAMQHTFQTKWNKLDADLRAESKVGGQKFKGARYVELKQRLDDLEEKYDVNMAALDAEQSQQQAALDLRSDQQLAELAATWNNGQSAAKLKDFTGTPEAQNPAVVRFVATIETLISHEKLTPQAAAIAMTLLITLLIEVLPIVLFGNLLRILMPVTRTVKPEEQPSGQTARPTHQRAASPRTAPQPELIAAE